MDDALVATVLLGVVGTAVVLFVLWLWSRADQAREEETELIAGHELHRWADEQGWRLCSAPPRRFADPWVHELPRWARLVRAAEGRITGRARFGNPAQAGGHGQPAGHDAAIGLYVVSTDEGPVRFLALLVELPVAQPAVRIWPRYGPRIRRRNPALPEPDREFDRKLEVRLHSDVDASQLLVAPVRAALLKLITVAPDAELRMNGHLLRVRLDRWPTRPELTLAMDAVAGVVAALPRSPDRPRSTSA